METTGQFRASVPLASNKKTPAGWNLCRGGKNSFPCCVSKQIHLFLPCDLVIRLSTLSVQSLCNHYTLYSMALVSGRRRSAKLVPTFAGRGVSRNGSPGPLNSVFQTWGRYFFYSSSSSIDLRRLTRLSRPRSRPTTTQKNLAVPGIEPGTSVSVARNSDHQTTEAVGQLNMYI